MPIFSREARLRHSLEFLKGQLGSIDGNSDGYVPAGGLILLFASNLKALSIAETRILSEYIIQ